MENRDARAIGTLDDLRRHLQWAIELEHATIPPYMCTLYSLGPERNEAVLRAWEMHLQGGGGLLIPVHDVKSVLAALAEIIEQGEGAARTDAWDGDVDVFHPERDEVAHLYRFQELRFGRRYKAGDTPQSGPTGEAIVVDLDAVLPMRRDPRSADHPEGSTFGSFGRLPRQGSGSGREQHDD